MQESIKQMKIMGNVQPLANSQGSNLDKEGSLKTNQIGYGQNSLYELAQRAG